MFIKKITILHRQINTSLIFILRSFLSKGLSVLSLNDTPFIFVNKILKEIFLCLKLDNNVNILHVSRLRVHSKSQKPIQLYKM